MVNRSLDINVEGRFNKEEIKYTSESGSVYDQKKKYNRKGILEEEIWERNFIGGTIILEDAAYISNGKAKEIAGEIKLGNRDVSTLMRLAKKEKYVGDGGAIFMLSDGDVYLSSKIQKIEPPFIEEYNMANDLDNF
ncbi:MAG: hypothetical protein FVQ80_17710 [Planctomycetes bacterium]|nr:hypothetical protein [Planctomycetota bacterium]